MRQPVIRRQTTHRIPLALAASLSLLIASCASPNSRIGDHPEIFAKATPEEQALIRKGEIALGFTQPFVRLALGDPDRVTERTTQNAGTETVWHYTEVENLPGYAMYGYDPAFMGPATIVNGPYGPLLYTAPYVPFYPTAPAGIERDKLRVTFHDGKVVAIERVVKDRGS
jgi:hypothetical protein